MFEIKDGVLLSYEGEDKEVRVPDGVIEIGESAFYGLAEAESVQIASSVKKIGRSAFAECQNLRSIILPEGLEVIGDTVFEHCRALESARVPDSVLYLGRGVFSKCESLTRVRLPEGLETIPRGCFMGDFSLARVDMPRRVTQIGDFAFYYCKSLEEMNLPDLVVNVYPHSLYGCSGLKRGYIAGLNLARYAPDDSLLFAMLYLTSKERYSYWESQQYESFIRVYRDKMCAKILEARSFAALEGLLDLDILSRREIGDWMESARAAGEIEIAARLLRNISAEHRRRDKWAL